MRGASYANDWSSRLSTKPFVKKSFAGIKDAVVCVAGALIPYIIAVLLLGLLNWLFP